jgi:hypothetical protein
METIQNEEERKEKNKIITKPNKFRINKLCNNFKWHNICVTGVPKGKTGTCLQK